MENSIIIIKNGKQTVIDPIPYGEIVIKFANGVPIYVTTASGTQI